MKRNNNVIEVTKNKILVRKSDGVSMGQKVFLGYTWYLNGKHLGDKPHLEVPEDYKEVYTLEYKNGIRILIQQILESGIILYPIIFLIFSIIYKDKNPMKLEVINNMDNLEYMKTRKWYAYKTILNGIK